MSRMKSRRFVYVLITCIITFLCGSLFASMTASENTAEPDAAVASDDAVLFAAPDEGQAPDAVANGAAGFAAAPDAAIPENDAALAEEANDILELAAVPEDASATYFAVVNEDGEETWYDLALAEDAQAYVDGYADNLNTDPDFDAHLKTAIEKVREDNRFFATWLALLPPVIAIVLALITKEVYSSLVIGIIAGGVLYSGFSFEGTLVHVVSDGFIASLSDSYNMGIIIFLVLLGVLVAMMNKAGGSSAFGKWAAKHVKSRRMAGLVTILLGVLIFIDDYFNCLTVGSVMRPVTDENKISRAKLSYFIDATAAPICIIAPISSWAAAVAGFARSAGAESGMSLFIRAIPYNFYAILTIVMMLFIAVTGFDFGPMKKYEKNAIEKGDLFTNGGNVGADTVKINEKGKVIDLVLPVVFLIIACVIGMIYSGGFFDGTGFVEAFSNSDASVGLAYGAFVTIIFAVIYFLIRRVMKFTELLECVPEGFKAMVSAILILACAWTLKAMTDSLGAKIFISRIVENSAGSFNFLLPAIIFVIAVGLSFATGTSWGTFGILIPIVLSVFTPDNPVMIVAISACMAGAVCGDHCSPISDTTIMASAGAQCEHINHVSTQLPYALTVAGVSAVTYIVAGLTHSAVIALPVGIVLMIGTLIVIKTVMAKKA